MPTTSAKGFRDWSRIGDEIACVSGGAGTDGAGSSAPRILFPYNGSPIAQAALSVAAEWALALRAEAWVLHVRPCDVARGGHYYVETQAEARALVAHAVAQLRAYGVSTSGLVRHADRGRISRVIRAEADVLDVSVIVVGTRARGVFGAMLLGSISRSLARRTTRPVVLVKAGSAPTVTPSLQPPAQERPPSSHPVDRRRRTMPQGTIAPAGRDREE